VPRSNFADTAQNAADAVPKPEEELAGLQQLWDEIFGSVLRFCQEAATTDVALARQPPLR
jgi:hypothetical protein